MENNCPICGKLLISVEDPDVKTGDDKYYNCSESCGEFKISRSLLKSLPGLIQEDENRAFLLSHFLRKMQGREVSSPSKRPTSIQTITKQ